MKYKLNFELVPESCWCSNLRSQKGVRPSRRQMYDLRHAYRPT